MAEYKEILQKKSGGDFCPRVHRCLLPRRSVTSRTLQPPRTSAFREIHGGQVPAARSDGRPLGGVPGGPVVAAFPTFVAEVRARTRAGDPPPLLSRVAQRRLGSPWRRRRAPRLLFWHDGGGGLGHPRRVAAVGRPHCITRARCAMGFGRHRSGYRPSRHASGIRCRGRGGPGWYCRGCGMALRRLHRVVRGYCAIRSGRHCVVRLLSFCPCGGSRVSAVDGGPVPRGLSCVLLAIACPCASHVPIVYQVSTCEGASLRVLECVALGASARVRGRTTRGDRR